MNLPFFVALATEENPYNYLNPGGIAFNLSVLIVGLLLGGLLAAIASVLYQRTVSRFFVALRHADATSPKTAKTLEELEIKPILGMRRALLSRTSLVRKLTTVVLPDGRVIRPLRSLDDDLAEKESAASAIHAEGDAAEKAGEKALEASEAAAGTDEAAAEAAPLTLDAAKGADALHFDVLTAAYYLDDLHRRRAQIRFEKQGSDLRFLIPAIIAFVILFATLPVYLPYFAKMLDTLLSSVLGGPQ